MNFYIIRLIFHPTIQKTLSDFIQDQTIKDPFLLLEEIIQKNPIYSPNIKDGTFYFKIANFVKDCNNRLLSAKIGHNKEQIDPDIDGKGDFIEKSVIKYPHITIFFDSEQQVILIQKNEAIFRINRLIRSLQTHFNYFLKDYELLVALHIVANKAKFWDTVESSEKIYWVEFNLSTPNFAGFTQESIRKMLCENEKKTNLKNIFLKFLNKDGDLKIKKENTDIIELERWARNGGGEWKVSHILKGHTKRGTTKSIDNPEICPVDSLGNENDMDQIIRLIQTCKIHYELPISRPTPVIKEHEDTCEINDD